MIGAIFVKFSQLILIKIIQIVATRCQMLRLKCTKFNFGWGSAPDPARGTYSATPDLLAGFKGTTSKGRGGERRECRQERGPLYFFCGPTPTRRQHTYVGQERTRRCPALTIIVRSFDFMSDSSDWRFSELNDLQPALRSITSTTSPLLHNAHRDMVDYGTVKPSGFL